MLNSNNILTYNTGEDHQPLSTLLKNGPMNIKSFLKIAIAITRALSDLHQENIIYQNVHPGSILVNLKHEAVKIIQPAKNISTDLSYISPEQTGRVNGSIDFRSDLYSIGIIFYHMLAGKHPFCSDNPMEMVHSHLAQKAQPLHELDNYIPKILSDIVEKLMEKKADHRYQSAYGLKYDLEECLKRLSYRREDDHIEDFVIGAQDLPDKLRIPDQLYCREQEMEKLMTAYDRVKKGSLEIVFVAGSPGVGKTMLVNHVLKEIQNTGATCSSGKFDQYKKNTPYSAFIQAFQQITKSILSENDEKVEQWKDRILDRLSGNGQLMIDVIPEIQKIIGPQPTVQTLGPMEAQIRFNTVFINFIQLFASKDNPLVLFVDDLQWADDASIKLLENILKDTDRQHILIIGAYREEEVKESLHMSAFLEAISKEAEHIGFISLQPLKISAITRMIAEILRRTPEESEQFAQICYQKTQGNPFFLIQFLLTLKEDGFLWLNREAGMWQWNLDGIVHEDATENVVGLMIKKIQKLPQESIEILKTAACMNHSFTIRTLATVTEQTQYTISEYLQVAVEDGLIVKEQEGYRFLHDRVQQAVYSLVDDDKKCIIHHKIAKLLYENTAGSEKEAMLFEIVDHYNMAQACISEVKEQQLIAQLNLQAGKKAKASSAYERALEYFKSGIKLLGADKWEEKYDITLDLHIQAIEAAYVCTQFQLMEKTAGETLAHVKNILDEARVYEVLIAAYTVQNNLRKALETGRYILKRLGINIPKNPTLAHIFWLYIRIQHALRDKEMEEILNIPPLTNEKYITAMSILNTISMASYSSSYYTTIIIGFYVMLLSLKHGITDVTIIAYSGHGFICGSLLHRAQQGYKFGQLALKLQEKMDMKKYECKTRLMFNMLIRHGVDPLRKTLEDFPHTYECGFASGDLISAGHCIMQYFVYSYFSGRELAAIEKEWHEHRSAMLKTKHETSIRLCEIYLQTILNFKGDTGDPCRLTGKYFDEDTMLPVYKESNDRTVVFNIYFHRMIQYYSFGKADKALENVSKVWEYLDGVLGTYCTSLVHFYTTLVIAANMDTFTGIQKHVYGQKINKSIKAMERFSRSAPENNLHKLYLMKAERARIYQDFKEAATYYDLAVEQAGKNRFIQEEALANEAAGRFYHAMGRKKIAAIYIENACSCYQRWGAAAKVKDLETKYAEMLLKNNRKRYSADDHAGRNDAYNALSNIDLHAIIKASQAISGEIQLDELLKLLIKTVLQNSGARKAVFLINEEGNLTIAAKGHADGEIQLVQSNPLDEDRELPQKLIHYVVRTREEVILASPTSMLCMPVIVKGKIIGILYLENELIQGAFNRERLYILQMLASQIAISLENAKLYKQMEGIIEKRTKELREKNKELVDTNKKLVNMMQGEIQVESIQGVGSTFICTLPFNIADNIKVLEIIEERAIPQKVNRDLRGLKVVAAEDNSINQIYIKHLLEYYNCDVTLTDNGNGLLQLMQENEYDCILMDKNMPEKDGVEVTRIIRQNEAGTGRHIPIIALTASAIVGDREKLLAEGMDYYLSKPMRENELLNILSEISSKAKQQDIGAECLPEYLIEGVKHGDGATAAPGFGEAVAPSPCFATDEGSAIPMYDFRMTNALSAISSLSSCSGDSFIDMEIFKEEAELFGKDIMADIINEFLNTYKRKIEQIETDLGNKDCIKLEKSAHKLAGSIANFYADEIYTLVKNLEKTAHSGNIEEAAPIYAKLTACIDPFIQELVKIKDTFHS